MRTRSWQKSHLLNFCDWATLALMGGATYRACTQRLLVLTGEECSLQKLGVLRFTQVSTQL